MATTARPTEPLRREHADLLPHIERLAQLGDLAADPDADVLAELQACVEFLHHHLLVHARAEEEVLYPFVSAALGAPSATATMSRDHVEIERLASELADVTPEDRATVARLAYGLHALVKVHFAKEEEVYLDLLDEALGVEEVAAMYARMEEAAAAVRHGA